MIGDTLRVQVEDYAAQLGARNPLYGLASSGQLSREHVTLYLGNLRALVAHTPVHLARALHAARLRGDEPLAAHFEERIREEEGHEEWAVQDLAAVSRSAKNARTDVLPAMRSLLNFIESTIDEDPTLYLAYILFAEYITVLAGPAFLRILDERCGIPPTAMTVVAKHAELDVHHVQEALDKIDDLVAAPEKLPMLRRVLAQSIQSFEAFCADVARAFPQEDHVQLTAPRRVDAHVSPS